MMRGRLLDGGDDEEEGKLLLRCPYGGGGAGMVRFMVIGGCEIDRTLCF